MSRWPMVPLGQILDKPNERINIEPTKRYKEVTVRLWGKGVVLRREVSGAEIASASRIVVRENQFIISRIDARNGASGLVPEDLDGAVVSSDFPVFRQREDRVHPQYLGWLSRTDWFVALCQHASEGTTNRIRLKENRFLAMAVPLPPVAEQRRIVNQIADAVAKLRTVERIREEVSAKTSALTKSAKRQVFGEVTDREMTIQNVCTTIVDCLHSNPVYADDGVPTVRSPDVGWGKILLGAARKTSEAEFRRRTVRGEPAPGDVVVVREGGGTGKAGIVEDGQRFSLGQRVMMLRPDRDKIEPRYLLHYWLSPLIYEDQVANRMLGSASPHLNIGAAKTFPIRLPPLVRQRQIVSYLDRLEVQIEALRGIQESSTSELSATLPAMLRACFGGPQE